MSRLSELIRDLCPDGVEYRTLSNCVILPSIPRGLKRMQYETNAPFPIVDQGRGRIAGYSSDVSRLVKDVPGIIFGDHTREIKYIDFPYVPGAEGIKWIRATGDVALRYLFHYLKSLRIPSRGYNRHWGTVRDLPVPVPPLEVQQEVVRILDQFTTLEAELEAELEARRKQYEYYREQLMHKAAICETRALIDISIAIRSGGTPRSNNASYYNGVVPWLRTQDIDFCDIWETSASITEEGLCNSSAKWVPIGCVIIAMYGATAAKAAMNRIPLTMNQACCAFEIDNSKAVARYVYHWIASQYVPLRSQGEGSQNNLSVGKLKKIQVPLPSIYEQRRIADILDRFDALVNDISSGLPAEIAARRKQYEHYRDRLLSFPEKEA